MEKITLNEYLKQGSVVENLKNFVGVTPENTMGLMTPERLAAVAGEKLGFYVKHSIVEIPTLNDRINVAKKIVSALPRIAGILSFDVTFSCTGIHQAHGYIYNGKQHGIIKIDILFGGAYNVKINNGEYTVM